MNIRMTVYILGLLLMFESVFMAVPIAAAAVYREHQIWLFAAVALFCLVAGWLMTLAKPQKKTLLARDGFVIVALSWIVMSFFGALPFYISGCIPHFVDALFESVSGFTTTGASILHEVESLPKCMNMWRCFTHWVGGMGVLVFIMAIMPISGGQNMYLMKAESPGPSVSKLVPRVRTTAIWLYGIYLSLTFLEFVFLLFGRMSVYDALNISFATAGTGGFAIRNASIGCYNPYTQIVVSVFMGLFALNFATYFLMLRGKFKEAVNTEMKVFLSLVLFATVTITLNVRHLFHSAGEALRHAAFTVSSLISSTGFATVDFNQWPVYSRTLLVILMFIGACAGSTGGGMKVSRIIILAQNMHNELRVMTHPRQVKIIKVDGHAVENETLRTVHAYIACYILIFVASMLLLSFNGLDETTNFTAVVATINNIGPGLNLVGPTSNYDVFSDLSKWTLIFDMLAGRLELFPIVLLMSPATWKK